jgi:hypothetical protein
MKLTLNKRDIYQVALLAIIFIALDIAYVDMIQTHFSYMGFNQTSTSLFFQSSCYLLSVVLSFLVVILANQILDKFFLIFILLFMTYPSIILFKNGASFFNIVVCHVLFLLFIGAVIYSNTSVRLPRFKINGLKTGTILLLTAIIGVIPFFLIYKFNINFQNLLLENIYETRAAQKEGSNLVTAYLYSPMSKIVIPFGLIYFIYKKKRIPLMIFGMLGIYFFLIGAHKSVLFGNLLCVGIYFLNKNFIIDYFLYAILSAILIGFAFYYFSENIFITSLILRRVFFLPALLDTFYFEFFKDLKMMYSHSFLEGLVPNKLGDTTPALKIGDRYFNGSNANNGLISDGFMNLGYVGIGLNFFIVATFYTLIRSLRLKNLYIGIPFLFFFNVVSSAPLTVLLTHGGIFFLILSTFLSETKTSPT